LNLFVSSKCAFVNDVLQTPVLVLFHLTLKQIAEKNQTGPQLIGVADHRSGFWISGRCAFYMAGA